MQSHININLSSTSRLNFKRDLDIEIVEARLVKKFKLITKKLTSHDLTSFKKLKTITDKVSFDDLISLKKSNIQQLIEMSIAIMFSSIISQSMQAQSFSRLTFKKHFIHQLSLKTLLNSIFDKIIDRQCNQIFFDQSKSFF